MAHFLLLCVIFFFLMLSMTIRQKKINDCRVIACI